MILNLPRFLGSVVPEASVPSEMVPLTAKAATLPEGPAGGRGGVLLPLTVPEATNPMPSATALTAFSLLAAKPTTTLLPDDSDALTGKLPLHNAAAAAAGTDTCNAAGAATAAASRPSVSGGSLLLLRPATSASDKQASLSNTLLREKEPVRPS
jgi:hypothetical protein